MSSVRFRPSTITPLLFFCARPKNTGWKSISRGCDSWCCIWHFTPEDGEESESDTPEFQNVPPHSSLHFNSRKWIAAPPLDRSGHCSLLPIHGNSWEACCCFWAEGRRCAQLCWVERERELRVKDCSRTRGKEFPDGAWGSKYDPGVRRHCDLILHEPVSIHTAGHSAKACRMPDRMHRWSSRAQRTRREIYERILGGDSFLRVHFRANIGAESRKQRANSRYQSGDRGQL